MARVISVLFIIYRSAEVFAVKDRLPPSAAVASLYDILDAKSKSNDVFN